MKRTVFITGASGGLGIEIVKLHLSLGDAVWALDVSDTLEIRELKKAHAELFFIQCDISKTILVQTALAGINAKISKLDILYSCAGIYRFEDKKLLPETILDNAASMFDINAVGFLRVVQVLLGVIGDDTTILCVTSEAGSLGENFRAAEYNYCMSKAAENMACVILQKYLESLHQNCRVLCIHPGWLRTTMGGKDAFDNPEQSVDPHESAENIVGIARDIAAIPKEQMFMDYKRTPLKW